MSYLLRVELPDVPGSLGRMATAVGTTGADIDAIEIVEHRPDGVAVDDVFLELPPGVMPDSVVSALHGLDDMRVLWISRYAAGSNLTRDLEVVEAMTSDPASALDRLVELLPATFVVDWAMRLRRTADGAVVEHRTGAAPSTIPDGLVWPEDLARGSRIEVPEEWELLVAGCPLGADRLVVIARRGGPPILDSEIARLAHLVAMAPSIARPGA